MKREDAYRAVQKKKAQSNYREERHKKRHERWRKSNSATAENWVWVCVGGGSETGDLFSTLLF